METSNYILKYKPRVLLVGYTRYSCDARIKAYVCSLEEQGVPCEVWSLKEPGIRPANVVHLIKKYQGNNPLFYVFSYLSFFCMVFIKALLNIKKYDLIHYNNMPNFPVWAFIFNKLAGTSIVIDNHDVMPELYRDKFGLSHRHWIVKLLELEQRFAFYLADHVITADNNQLDYVRSHGVKASISSALLNVPNPNLFPRISSRITPPFKFVYHGTITQRLGIDIAIRAFAKAKHHLPDIEYHLIGEGDYLDEARRLVSAMNMDTTVIFSGRFYPVEELTGILSVMDAGLIANRNTLVTAMYMLPVKLLEYVYLKKPVIAPRLPIIERYFDSGMVLYFTPEDESELTNAIIKLATSPELCSSLTFNAGRFYTKYNWETKQKHYFDLIEKLTEKSII